MNNMLRTTLLLAALTGLIVWIGQLLGGSQGAVLALVLAAIMNIGSYWFSDRIVIKMYGGQEIHEQDDPELYAIVKTLAQQNHMPMPRLFLIPTDSPNAFATGRNPDHAAVAVTAGIRRLLTRRELQGVLAHELAHVTNRDILISSIAATLAGAIMMLARMAQYAMIFGGGRRDDRDEGGGAIGLLVTIDPRPARRHADPDGDLPLARVPGRRHRGATRARSGSAGVGVAEDRRRCCAGATRRQPADGAYVHRQSAARRRRSKISSVLTRRSSSVIERLQQIAAELGHAAR